MFNFLKKLPIVAVLLAFPSVRVRVVVSMHLCQHVTICVCLFFKDIRIGTSWYLSVVFMNSPLTVCLRTSACSRLGVSRASI